MPKWTSQYLMYLSTSTLHYIVSKKYLSTSTQESALECPSTKVLRPKPVVICIT